MYNFRLCNIIAVIGRGQLEVIDSRVSSRRAVYSKYFKALSKIQGISFHKEPDKNFRSNRWLTAILIDPLLTGGITCEDIRLALEKENIEARPLWKPLHIQPVFSAYPAYLNGVSESLFKNGLCLP